MHRNIINQFVSQLVNPLKRAAHTCSVKEGQFGVYVQHPLKNTRARLREEQPFAAV